MTMTDQRGIWRLDELVPGDFSITVRKSGYRTASIRQVRVVLNQKTRLDFQIMAGSDSDTVDVTGTVSALQTDDAAESYLLPSQFVRDLPLPDRNVILLFSLGPGAIPRQLGGFVHDIINDLQPAAWEQSR